MDERIELMLSESSIGLLSSSTVQENGSKSEFPKIPFLKVLSDRMAVYQLNERPSLKRPMHLNSMANLAKKERTGKISSLTCSKLRSVIDTWLNSIMVTISEKKGSFENNTYYPVFITLTLPAKQVHDDKFCNRFFLQQFLEKYKYHTAAKNIFWRAESQKNGNIHYHIIGDRYWSWKVVRQMWNDILENYGYIDEFERINGHRNPNSTDVKGASDVKDFVKYVLKYVSKIEQYRVLNCRLWGMTDSLRSIKACTMVVDSKVSDELQKIINQKSTLTIKKDFVDVILYRESVFAKLKLPTIKQFYKSYLREIYKSMYCTLDGEECNDELKVVEQLKEEEVKKWVQLQLFSDRDMVSDQMKSFSNNELFEAYW